MRAFTRETSIARRLLLAALALLIAISTAAHVAPARAQSLAPAALDDSARGGSAADYAAVLYQYRAPLIALSALVAVVIAVLAVMTVSGNRSKKELRAAYERERAARAQEKTALEIAEKESAAKGNFMSRVSHEIRTPLNAVIGYNTIARNLLTQAGNDAERRQAEMKVMDCLTKSELASRHLLTIINDVLDMSAIESGRISVARDRFDFRALISSVTTIFYSQAKAKGVEFETVFDTLTEEWFVGDQMRLNQILSNLLSNAVKFTPEGGSVKLTVRQPEARTDASHICFEVSDTGIGMTREYLEHIWTPFEQADASIARRFGGSGLGLSITKNLVDLMGGTIRVTSQLGVGTTFRVDIKLQRTEQPQSAKIYDFSAVNALVVDDDAGTCDYVKLLFDRCGARCTAVTSGEAAVRAVAAALNRGEAYSLCLVDWRMPKMDGLETIRRIRGIVGERMPIVVITAYDYSEIADRAARDGVNMFIAKPLFQSSLFDLLANVSASQAPPKIEKSVTYNFAGARVLLAEDNAMNMEIARRILESVGLVVDCAWNGKEALAKYEAAPEGAYQAILLDVQMPEMDGHEAARAIRACAHSDAATVPIIAMTADAFAENVAQALASGMNDHVSKPIDLNTLFDTLKKYISNAI